MKDVMASACCTRGSSGSGANHNTTGISTPRILPLQVSQAVFPSTAAGRLTGAACVLVVISLRQDFAPLCFHRATHFSARLGDRRKFVDPLVGPAAIDYRARGVALFVALADHRIQRAAPTAAYNFDILLGVGACAERPEYIIRVGGIDVVVHDNRVAAEVCADVTITGHHAGLAR